eukprot:7250176-Pyramimonas_sp.AAC.1
MQLGFSAKAWDIIHGAHHDITDPAVLRLLLSDIRDGRVFAAMIALPCTSLTIARDRTFQIRSRTQPWGTDLTNATDRDRASLETGNRIIRAVLRILRHLNRFKIPWILENPSTSRL